MNAMRKLERMQIPRLTCSACLLAILVAITLVDDAYGQVTGSGTIGKIPKWTATSALGDSAVTESSGFLGIGTAAPTAKLHVSGPSSGFGSGLKLTSTDSGGKTFSFYPWVNSLFLADETAAAVRLAIDTNGNVGLGTSFPSSKLHVVGSAYVTGNLTVDGNIAAKYQDVAEWVPAREAIPAGNVVILDADHPNHVLTSSRAYDTRVAGVVSATPGLILGEGGEGKVMVATTGRVRVKVDATKGAIRIGDLLVTSDKEGVAMKSQPLDLAGTPIHRPGTLIGKALEPLEKGIGEILVLLSLQ